MGVKKGLRKDWLVIMYRNQLMAHLCSAQNRHKLILNMMTEARCSEYLFQRIDYYVKGTVCCVGSEYMAYGFCV